MSEFWQIIGLSSLIASIIGIIGNIIANTHVEKKRFQRESEAGYVQDQIKLYSKMYFLIQRIRVGAISEAFFNDFILETKELNSLLQNSSFLLETKILMKWFEINKLFVKLGMKGMERDEFFDALWPELDNIATLIRKKVNSDLNPRYSEIVGKTVPMLIPIDIKRRGAGLEVMS